MTNNLDSFVQFSRPQPKALAVSQEIRDRGSNFIATAYRASTPDEAHAAINHLKHVVHGPKPASHEISAWRCMVLKSGRSGLGGPDDFELKTGSDDDGENWAGAKVLKVMQTEGVIDAVVIVSRWYGGTLLGPARFSHIEICALEACRTFKRKEELEECISSLNTLDDILADLRAELVAIPPSSASSTENAHTLNHSSQHRTLGTTSGKHDYSAVIDSEDVSKARRLIAARENAIKGVKTLLSKKRDT